AEKHIMARPPRDARAPILSGFMLWRIVFVSMLMVAATLGLFLLETAGGTDIETARTVAVNTLVVCEAVYLVNTRYLTATSLTRDGMFGSRYVLVAIVLVLAFQIIFTYMPLMQNLFATRAIGLDTWTRIAAAGLVLFLLVEAEKTLIAGPMARSP
ncbi:MAG: cation transporting ATPase C-terminal domain-containing protein, partial [Gammaproteobacteria bacterium]|nr:cation transporting ATPase C-terminal domain-containing protein [Gammaproteobacteria bacterium]